MTFNRQLDTKPRVAFLTNLTAADSLPVLEALAKNARVTLSQVIFYDTVGEARSSPLKVLKQFGLRRLLGKLASLVVSKVRRVLLNSPLRNCLRPANCFEYTVANQIPYSVTANLNTATAHEQIKNFQLEFLLVCVCKNILKANTLELFPLGAINIHPSMLPHYRGPLPIFWMLYHGEPMGGVTFHRITPEIDAGPIIGQYPQQLDHGLSEAELSLNLFRLAASKLDDILRQFLSCDAPPPSSTHEKGSYYSYPTAAQQAKLLQILRSRRREKH